MNLLKHLSILSIFLLATSQVAVAMEEAPEQQADNGTLLTRGRLAAGSALATVAAAGGFVWKRVLNDDQRARVGQAVTERLSSSAVIYPAAAAVTLAAAIGVDKLYNAYYPSAEQSNVQAGLALEITEEERALVAECKKDNEAGLLLWQVKLMAVLHASFDIAKEQLVGEVKKIKNPHALLKGFAKNAQGGDKRNSEALVKNGQLDALMIVLQAYTVYFIEGTKAALIKSLTAEQKAAGLEKTIQGAELKNLLTEKSLNAEQKTELVTPMNAAINAWIKQQEAFAVIIAANKAEKAEQAKNG